MSVLIRGMEMPKSCYACMFFAQTDYWNKEDEADILSHCKRTGEKTWESVNGYLPNCPLIPVPPHGRLIDGDKLAEEQKENVRAYHANLITLDDLAECLLKQSISEDGAPTIIQAEEGE